MNHAETIIKLLSWCDEHRTADAMGFDCVQARDVYGIITKYLDTEP